MPSKLRQWPNKCPEIRGKVEISTKDVLTRSLNALADTETAHHVLKHFLDSERYFRLSPPLQNIVELNEVRKDMLDQMIKDTRRYIKNNHNIFRDLAETLMEPPGTVDSLMRSCKKTLRDNYVGLRIRQQQSFHKRVINASCIQYLDLLLLKIL